MAEEVALDSKRHKIGKASLNYEQLTARRVHQSVRGHGPILLEHYARIIDSDRMLLQRVYMERLRWKFVERYLWTNMKGNRGADTAAFGLVPQADEHDVFALICLRSASHFLDNAAIGMQIFIAYNLIMLVRVRRRTSLLFGGARLIKNPILDQHVAQ